jgi:hypothetical protein
VRARLKAALLRARLSNQRLVQQRLNSFQSQLFCTEIQHHKVFGLGQVQQC